MKNLFKLLLLPLVAMVLTGCPPANTVTNSPAQKGETKVYIPWTVQVGKDFSIVPEEYFQTQFYTDGGELLLTHMDTLPSKKPVGGVWRLGLSNPTEGVRVKVKTLAKVVGVDKEHGSSPRWICVIVEHGGLKRYIYFVQSSLDGRYYFFGDRKPVQGKVVVMYDNKQHTASSSNQSVYLSVEATLQSDAPDNIREAEGVRFDEKIENELTK